MWHTTQHVGPAHEQQRSKASENLWLAAWPSGHPATRPTRHPAAWLSSSAASLHPSMSLRRPPRLLAELRRIWLAWHAVSARHVPYSCGQRPIAGCALLLRTSQ